MHENRSHFRIGDAIGLEGEDARRYFVRHAGDQVSLASSCLETTQQKDP